MIQFFSFVICKMQIVFCIPHRAVYLSAHAIFEGLENVTVIHESVASGQHDALITFGDYFDDFIGDDIKSKLTVGQADVINIDHQKYKWLIYAPNTSHMSNVKKTYLAFKSALIAMRDAGIAAASMSICSKNAGSIRQMRAALEYVTACDKK